MGEAIVCQIRLPMKTHWEGHACNGTRSPRCSNVHTHPPLCLLCLSPYQQVIRDEGGQKNHLQCPEPNETLSSVLHSCVSATTKTLPQLPFLQMLCRRKKEKAGFCIFSPPSLCVINLFSPSQFCLNDPAAQGKERKGKCKAPLSSNLGEKRRHEKSQIRSGSSS